MVSAEHVEPKRVARRAADATRLFSYYAILADIHSSARRHGVADEDIVHAIDNALAIEDAGQDPERWLVIGPDHAANLLELVVLITRQGRQLVIHAMAMRPHYERLIRP
jgi:hypothetical protein